MYAQQFVLVLAGLLIPPTEDKRDRDNPKYREWEAELARDLKARGMRSPIIVIRDGKFYRVLAGETRRRAALLAGLQQVPVSIIDRPLTRAEQLQEQLLENMMRKDMSPLEEAELFLALMEANHWTQAELAKNLGIKPARVSKTLRAFNRLPADLRALIGTGKGQLGPTIAYQLSRLDSHDKMRQRAAKFLNGDICRDGIVEPDLNGKKAKKPNRRALKFNGAIIEIPDGWTVEDIKKLIEWLSKLGGDDFGKVA